MEIIVMNREDAKRFSYSKSNRRRYAIISISSPYSAINKFKESQYKMGILYLSFADEISGKDIITDIDGKKIKNFVMRMKDKIDLLIVHCDAGISRSAGVAAAIMKALYKNDWPIFDSPKYTPNMLCYRTVLKAFDEEIDEFDISEKLNRNIELWNRANGIE